MSKNDLKLLSAQERTAYCMGYIIVWLVFFLGGSVAMSFPSSYTYDFIASQFSGCAVRLENPVIRTAVGAIGGSGGGVGLIGGVISKGLEMTVPSMSDNFHQERCKN